LNDRGHVNGARLFELMLAGEPILVSC
jgi:hypothetical protein